jgi:chromosome partitioning protein
LLYLLYLLSFLSLLPVLSVLFSRAKSYKLSLSDGLSWKANKDMTDKPATLCLSNRKGGVGKTTCSIHIAGALADRGRDVLLFDLDPQGTITRGLGYDDYYGDLDRDISLHEVLLERDALGHVNETIEDHPEFDVARSHKRMTFDTASNLKGEPRAEDRLELALDRLDRTYDYIIVDCPPSLDILTDNALLATENVLIPTYPEELSVQGIELLFDQIDELEEWHETEIRKLGLIANRIEVNNEAAEYLDLFEENFGALWDVWQIRKRVVLQRAITQGHGSIFTHDEDCDMVAEFENIARTLDEMFGLPDTDADSEVVAR